MAGTYKNPVLFLIRVNGRDVAAVRALNAAEARDWFVREMVDVSLLSPSQAFHLGSFGEVELHNAKPEYAEPREGEDRTGDLFVHAPILGDEPLPGPAYGVPLQNIRMPGEVE